jgi:basic amino acid/polyamine antiporter, APA family
VSAPGSTHGPGASDTLLVRELGVRQLAASIFNYVVGAGVFVLPAFAAARLGAAAVLAYLPCILVMVLAVLCFAAAGSRVASSGGPYAYVSAAFGPYAAYLVGVLNLLSALVATGLVAGFFASSVLALVGSTDPVLRVALMIAALAVATALNVRGVRTGARLAELLTVAKLVPLLGFVVLGAFAVRPEFLTWSDTPPASSVFGTAGLIILAFVGMENAVTPSGEVRDPARTVPRAAVLAMTGVVVLYISVQLVAQGLLGPSIVNEPGAPLAAGAGAAFGPAARVVMLIGAAISMFGNISASVLAAPRGVFALGRDGFAPRVLAAVHPDWHTPHVAIVVYVVVALVLGASGSVERLAILTNLASLLVYVAVALAAWALQRRDVRLEGPPFVLPGGPLIPLAASAAIAAVIYAAVSRTEWMAVGGALALASAGYGLRARGQTRT